MQTSSWIYPEHQPMKSNTNSENASYNTSPSRLAVLKSVYGKSEDKKTELTSSTTSRYSPNLKAIPELTLDDLLVKYKADNSNKATIKRQFDFDVPEPHTAAFGLLSQRLGKELLSDAQETRHLASSKHSQPQSPSFSASSNLKANRSPNTNEKVYDLEYSQHSTKSLADQNYSLLNPLPGRSYGTEPLTSENVSFSQPKSAAKSAHNIGTDNIYNSVSTRISTHLDYVPSRTKIHTNHFEKGSGSNSITDPSSRQSKWSPRSSNQNSRSYYHHHDPKLASILLDVNPLSSSDGKSSGQLEEEVRNKIRSFDLKMTEIQEELGQTKTLQDPYKVSLKSLPPMSHYDGIDSSASKMQTERREDLFTRSDRITESHTNSTNTKESYRRIQRPAPASFKPNTDYRENFEEFKLKYYDSFLPDKDKVLTNPYKIWKHKIDSRNNKKMRGFMDEFIEIHNNINVALFELKV